MRLAVYTTLSLAMAGCVILRSLHHRANVYSACVYLSQSNANLMILTNVAIVIVAWFIYGLQRILYGPLRPVEREQLYDRAWFAITETCLAMTIFRGSVGAWFLVMFGSLVIGKIWGWIAEGRVDTVEQRLSNDTAMWHSRYSLYIRLFISLSISIAFNSYMLDYCVKVVLQQARPDMMVMFGFEFAILLILSLSTFCRYCMAIYEVHIMSKQKEQKRQEERDRIRAERRRLMEQAESSGASINEASLPSENDIDDLELDVVGWEEKGRWVFGLNILTDFFKLVVYVCFFAILFTFYGLPIHIIRDMIFTLRSFVRRIVDFSRYRRATRDMNRRYPDATPEELHDADVCIICREEMRPWQPDQDGGRSATVISERWRPKKLPCGHILHFACLRSWLERQQSCPICRRPVTGDAPAEGAERLQHGAAGAAGGAGNVPAANARGGDAGVPAARARDGAPRNRAWFLNLGPLRIGFGVGRIVLPNIARQVRRQRELDQQQRQQQQQQQQQQQHHHHHHQHQQREQLQNVIRQQQQQQQQPQPQPQDNGEEERTSADTTQPAARTTTSSSVRGLFTRPSRSSYSQTFTSLPTVPISTSVLPTFPVSQSAQWQLAQIEHQIEQEVGALRATQEQLQIVRLLQGELNRLRATRTNVQQQMTRSSSSTGPRSTTPNLMHAQRFVSQPRESAIRSGDARLPTGVTIPRGWTLLPLYPAGGSQNVSSASAHHTTTSFSIPSIITPTAEQTQNPSQSQSAPNVSLPSEQRTPSSPSIHTHPLQTEAESSSSTITSAYQPPQTVGPSLPLNEETLAPFSFGTQQQPLAPEVQSREGDEPIPRDDSTSSSLGEFENSQQDVSDRGEIQQPSSMENYGPQSPETVSDSVRVSGHEVGGNSPHVEIEEEAGPSSELANPAHAGNESLPSREDKGKYRATVEDDHES
ncbi:E3 ubiquitin-protein ligase hrd1 [Ascosphaera aggregata]|nr:E3 ubiquitin-protein ligase hrd1 [Ascosphaera aggregata]